MNNLDCSSHSFELVIFLYHVDDRWIDKVKSKGDAATVLEFLPPSQQARLLKTLFLNGDG